MPGLCADVLADPVTTAVVVREGQVLRGRAGVLWPAVALVGAQAPSARALADERWVFLGVRRDTGAPLLAYRAPSDDEVSTGGEWVSVRAARPSLGDLEAEIVLTATALDRWHASHGRCARCGAPTRPVEAGWVRRCEEDGSDHHPRTDPAVIMAVVDDEDRLLLGHNARWPAARYSTLAGYVEPGESLEDAVRREVEEESGVRVGDVVYRASQPWPFPASLMLGFFARAETTELAPDGDEITDVRWVTRRELRSAVDAGDIVLPARSSIARALIEEWAGERLPGA